MSFCSDIKNELLNKGIKYNNFLPFLSSIIKCSGELCLKNKEMHIEIKTEYDYILKLINRYLKREYNVEASIERFETNFSIKKSIIEIPKEISNDLLHRINFYNKYGDIVFGIGDDFLKTQEDKLSFIKGTFIACATSNIVLENEKKSGSNIEFVFYSEDLALDFLNLLAEQDILAKKILRKNSYIVYLLSSNNEIFNFLVKIEAINSALRLKSNEAYNQLQNKVNRETNCEKGNINRMIEASLKQRQAIEIIEQTIGVSNLPPPLKEVCELRIAYPEQSIKELVDLSENKISKSGLNHRFNKIIEIAKNLKN